MRDVDDGSVAQFNFVFLGGAPGNILHGPLIYFTLIKQCLVAN